MSDRRARDVMRPLVGLTRRHHLEFTPGQRGQTSMFFGVPPCHRLICRPTPYVSRHWRASCCPYVHWVSLLLLCRCGVHVLFTGREVKDVHGRVGQGCSKRPPGEGSDRRGALLLSGERTCTQTHCTCLTLYIVTLSSLSNRITTHKAHGVRVSARPVGGRSDAGCHALCK